MWQTPIRALLAAAIALWLTMPAGAGFDEGMAAYERGDYAAALEQWQPLADEGRAGAQYNLGRLYAKGEGVPHDYFEAATWYRLAAEQGHGAAQFDLADLYKYGEACPRVMSKPTCGGAWRRRTSSKRPTFTATLSPNGCPPPTSPKPSASPANG